MFEAIDIIFAGLGLFLAGLRLLSTSLRDLSSGKLKYLFRWVNNRFVGIIWGIVAGAVSQSAAGITLIVSTMVSNRYIDIRTGLSIVGWLGVGTTILVILVSFNIKFAVLFLMGISGIVYAFNQSTEKKLIVSAFLGIGMLLFGFQFIGSGGRILAESPILGFLENYNNLGLVITFLLGAALRFLIQSQAGVTMLIISLSYSGGLGLFPIMMTIYGSYFMSGFIMYLFSKTVSGRAKQVCVYKSLTYCLTSILLVCWLVLENATGSYGIKYIINHYFNGIELQIAMIYLMSCIVEGLVSEIFMSQVFNLAKKISPDTEIDDYSTPRYITSSVEDTDVSVDLVRMELNRIIKRFSTKINNINKDYEGTFHITDYKVIYDSNISLLRHINSYFTEIFKSDINQLTAKKLMLVQVSYETVSSINDVIYNFIYEIKQKHDSNSMSNGEIALTEGLDAILLAFSDCAENDDVENLNILITLTSDKGQVFENLRLNANNDNDDINQKKILYITNLFQRAVWLINRWANLEKQLLNL